MEASRAASTRPRVASMSGQCRVTMSLTANSSSRLTRRMPCSCANASGQKTSEATTVAPKAARRGPAPADAAEPDDAHGGAEQFAGAPAEDAFPCLRIGAGLDGLVRVGQLALEADHRPDDVLCHGDRVLCWRVAYDEAEFRRRRVVHAVESGPCRLDDAHGAEPGQQIGVEAGVRRRHEEAFNARRGLRDGVWPVVGKKSKSAGNLHAAFLETRLGEQTEHMSHCILPGAEFP